MSAKPECEWELRGPIAVCRLCGIPLRMPITFDTDLTRVHRRCADTAAPRDPSRAASGPGSELHAILSARGYEITGDCACQRTMKMMNLHGPEWCLANMDKIADVMIREARKRKVRVLGIEPPEALLRLQAYRWIRAAVRNWLASQRGAQ